MPVQKESACERSATPMRHGSIWFEILVVVFLFVGVLMLFAWTSHRRALARSTARHAAPQPLAAQASPGASEDVSLDEAGDEVPVGSQVSAAG
ncbi:MAG TPA: hypothetical protein VLT61_16710 [Anaeromyxobacteraceae bacterium]|nr:hypothetical protein [Anaeromyxobacteraceae bacterium]